MKKLIFAMILLFVISTAQSQTTVSYGHYNGALSIGVTMTIDSNATSMTTPYVDWTQFGSTIYATYSLVQTNWDYAAGHDTVVVYLKGQDILGNTLNSDTISARLVSQVAATVVTASTGAISGKTITGATQTALTITSYFPQYAVYVAPLKTGAVTKNGKLAILYITFYSPTMNTIPYQTQNRWF